jgi:hypothetical protein
MSGSWTALAMVDMTTSHEIGRGWTMFTVGGGLSADRAASTMTRETASGGSQDTTPDGSKGKLPRAMLDLTIAGTQSVVDQPPLFVDPQI